MDIGIVLFTSVLIIVGIYKKIPLITFTGGIFTLYLGFNTNDEMLVIGSIGVFLVLMYLGYIDFKQ